MRLFLDSDGVLFDLIGYLVRWFHDGLNPYDDKKNHGIYDIDLVFGAGERERMFRNLGKQDWEDLEPTPEFYALIELASRIGWERTYVITTPLDYSFGDGWLESIIGKKRCFEKNIPQLINDPWFHSDKSVLCRGPGDFLIDDCEKNIAAWRDAGGQGVIWPQLWNGGFDQKSIVSANNLILEMNSKPTAFEAFVSKIHY
jgi:hypothetical protein